MSAESPPQPELPQSQTAQSESSPPSAPRLGLPELSSGQRLLRMSLAWALLFGAGPGFLTGDGSLVLTCAGLALWGATTLRPGAGKRRWCFLAETLPNAVGGGALMAWVWYVFPGAFAYVAFGFGVYWTLTAVVVRRLARRLPAAVAIGVGVLGVEGVRALLPPPIGLGWIQLGHVTHHHLWLSTSARVWGLEGLSFVVASLGGLGAAILLGAHRVARGEPRLRLKEVVFGLGPLALGIALSLLAPEIEERDGPLVLIVQPGFTQERKQFDDRETNFRDELELTRTAVDALVEAGTPPDLVLWAESMLNVNLFGPEVLTALRDGKGTPAWSLALTPDDLEALEEWEDAWVYADILGEGRYARGKGVLPDGTAFLSGTEIFTVVGEGEEREVRRRVCVVLYPHPADGSAAERQVVYKRNLVPGAETMLGLEQLSIVRDTIMEIAAYVPDFVPGEDPGVMEITTRAGATWRFGVSVCFDNAFLGTFRDVFFKGVEAGELEPPLDFHVVASNEAWYEGSFELDQMVAFTRIGALASARAVVRATNSGVSLVMGADGVERARIRDAEGRDRSTRGTLAMRVPVPLADARADRTPYVRWRVFWRGLGAVAPILAVVLGIVGRRRRAL